MLAVFVVRVAHVSRVTTSAWLHTSNIRPTETVRPTGPKVPAQLPPAPVPVPVTREMREIQIPVPWGQISGKWWGKTDAQPVLLLHGWQDNAGSFDNLIPLLNNEALFAIDMVGHGLSSHYLIGQCYHYIDALVNLRRVVKHFKWKKVSVIGHSIGSSLGFSYAGCYPDGVEKFVSIEGARAVIAVDRGQIARDLRNVIESNHLLEKKIGKLIPRYKYDEISDLYLKGIHYSTEKDTIKPILERGLTKSDDGDAFRFTRDPRVKVVSWASFSEDLVEAVAAQITCDVLNIRAIKGYTIGEKKQRVYQKTLDILKRSAKRVTYSEVDGSHYVHLNNAGAIAPLINKFFEKKTATEVMIY